MTASAGKPGEAGWRRLLPLLWLIVPALAAVIPWLWQRQHPPRPAPSIASPPLVLTGDRQRDRRAVLQQARDELLPSGRVLSAPTGVTPQQCGLLGEIGVALMPLDPAGGTQAVEQAIQLAVNTAEHGGPADPRDAENSRTGVLLHMARSLKPYPALARKALDAADQSAQAAIPVTARVFALCLFAREAAGIESVKARSALRVARGTADRLPVGRSPDAMAVVAAAVARMESQQAAAPLVEQALREIPTGPARPLVEARLAAALAEAIPAAADRLARQSLQHVLETSAEAGRGSLDASTLPSVRAPNLPAARVPGHRPPNRDGPLRAIAVLLAATHLRTAQAAVSQIRSPSERVAALTEMGGAVEARSPAAAGALFRRALLAAQSLVPGQGRHDAVLAAATGLSAYDLTPATNAVLSLHERLSPGDLLMLAARAVERQPEAAAALYTQVRLGDRRAGEAIEASEPIALAAVTLEPELSRVLDLAQHQQGRERQARALLVVARRLAAGNPKMGADTRRLGDD
jgi:hypothetical protein